MTKYLDERVHILLSHWFMKILPCLIACLLVVLPVLALAKGISAVVLFSLLCLLLFRHLEGWKNLMPVLWRSMALTGLLMAWPLLTSFWSIVPERSVVTAIRTATMLGIAFILLAWLKERAAVLLIAAYAYVAGVGAAIVILLSEYLPFGGLLNAMVWVFQLDHILYFFKDVNKGLCALAVLVWPALLMLEAVGRRNLIKYMLLWLLVGLMGLHSMSAKTGFLSGLAVFFILLRFPVGGAKLLRYGIPLVLLAWPVFFYVGESSIREKLYPHLPASSQHRIEIWDFAMEKWQEKPLLGWGASGARAIPGGLTEFRRGMVLMPQHPHNLSLQVLLEQGIIGYMLFLVAVWVGLRAAFSRWKDNALVQASIAACIMTYLVIGFSAFGMWQAWWVAAGLLAWLLTLMATGLMPLTEKKS